MNIEILNLFSYCWLGLAAIVFVAMFYVTAPFGRHTSEKWGMMVNNKSAWVLMELPSFFIMLYFFLFGTKSFDSYVGVLFLLWIAHYFNRTFVYPLRIKSTPKKMPLVIVLNAVLFNLVNAGLNGYYLAELAPAENYSAEWFSTPHFMIGILLFGTGMFINMRSDTLLIQLRKPGETGYKIPKGFLFAYISSPNLFGEIIEWCGFALMAWNLPALTFAVWTFANLVPRAKNHHDWYHSKFPDYPKERKAVVPFIF